MAKTGRPTKYSLEHADTICARIMDGESLRAICDGKDMPDKSIVLRWAADSELDFRDQYDAACRMRGNYYGERVAEIADQVIAGEIEPNAARAAMNGYKWVAARLDRKTWGDKAQHMGDDGGPLEIRIMKFGVGTDQE